MDVYKLNDRLVHFRNSGVNLIELEFNDTSTLVGHFVSSPRDKEKRDKEIVEEIKERNQEERGTGMKVEKQKK